MSISGGLVRRISESGISTKVTLIQGDTEMRFMTLVKSRETAGPPPQALIEAIAKLGEEAAAKGELVEMGGLFPSVAGARVRLSGGEITVVDGPFTEAKEVVGGYAVFELGSKQEAIEQTVRFMELHRKHWPGWDGETEIRQLATAPTFNSEPATR